MDMQQELAELARTAPPGRAALYEARIDELRASGVLDSALDVGDGAPDIALRGLRAAKAAAA
jgi:hypothetical protein